MRGCIAVIVLLCMSGCVTVQGAVKKGASFDQYTKIYLSESEDDPRKVIPKVREHLEDLGFTVIMTEEDEPLGGHQGTGFIVSTEGHIVTSAHVLGTQSAATVWLDGKRYEAEVLYKEADKEDDEATKEKLKSKDIQEYLDASLNSQQNASFEESMQARDMALLKIKDPSGPFVPMVFATSPVYAMGKDAYVIGFPLSNILGDKPRLNKGLISSVVGMKDHQDYVQVSAEIQPGNSGGPLLNADGQVIGMMQMTLNPLGIMEQTGGALPQNVNFAAKAAVIQEFLKNAGLKEPLQLREGEIVSFDDAQHSLVQVRSGIIPESFKSEPKLMCAVRYTYLWDMWFRFSQFEIAFCDWDTDEILLQAGQYKDISWSTENATIKGVFKEIRSKMGRQ